MAILLSVLILEATRRCVAKELSIISIIFLLYGYFGYLMPGVFHIRGGSIARLVNHIYMIPEGIFGTCLGTSANYIVLFVIFGAFLEKSGLGSLIQDIAIELTGRYADGPAKVAVLSSALFGTVSGSAAANVVTTGAFTIPLGWSRFQGSSVSGGFIPDILFPSPTALTFGKRGANNIQLAPSCKA